VKVLVCGSRSWDEHGPVRRRVADFPPETVIIHGGAAGADWFASIAASQSGLDQVVYPPNWKRHGRRAGIVRNLAMLDAQPDLVIAFWDGKSAGTRHTITEARKRGIPVEVIEP
jgi:hypothetical protein